MSKCTIDTIIERAKIAKRHSPIAVFKMRDTDESLKFDAIFAATVVGRDRIKYNKDFIAYFDEEDSPNAIKNKLNRYLLCQA